MSKVSRVAAIRVARATFNIVNIRLGGQSVIIAVIVVVVANNWYHIGKYDIRLRQIDLIGDFGEPICDKLLVFFNIFRYIPNESVVYMKRQEI